MRNTNFRSRANAVLVLVSSDVLLALAMWLAAFVPVGVLGRWPLSAVAIASIVPSVTVWIGVRAALGLYEESKWSGMGALGREAFALGITGAAITTGADPRVPSYHDQFLFWWALSLLVAAPVVRHYVKRAFRESS